MSAMGVASKVEGREIRFDRLPLRIKTLGDLEALIKNPRSAKALPQAGLIVSVPGLSPIDNRELELRIRAFVRSCGCAEGAAATLLGAVSIEGFIAVQMWMRGPQWRDLAWVVLGLLMAGLVGVLGKLSGIFIARLRFERCCRRVIQSLRSEQHLYPREADL